MMIIDGKKIAENILERLKAQPKPQKFLAAVLVGDDASSVSFLKQKEKTAQKLGVDFKLFQFPAAITKEDLIAEIRKLDDNSACGGIIVQLPLPNRADETEILNALSPEKDIDVLGERALAAFHAGESALMPPSVGTVLEVLNNYFSNPTATFHFLIGGTIAVVGAGRLVGQPIADWLRGKAKELIVLDKGDDLGKLKGVDLVISGAGVPGLITPEMLKEKTVVIDFGYGTKDGKVMGDFDSSLSVASDQLPATSYTPTPGGTGPILVAKLFENFYKLN